MIYNNEKFKRDMEKKKREYSNVSKFETIPVSPLTFFRDWMHSPLFAIQQEAVDRMLVKGSENIGELDWDTTYVEAYLLWGMGSGKDFVVSRMFTYIIYYLLCLKNPQEYFNIGGPTEPIDLINVSFDEDQAQFVFFKKLKMALASVKNPKSGGNWFEERGMKIKESSKSQMICFNKNITCYSLNSKEYKVEGKNVLLALFDEMAVFRPDKAEELYKILKGNMVSRFPNHHKFLAISYKRDDNDYMMTRWEQTKNDPRVFRSGPYWTWEVNELKKKTDFDDAFATDPEDAERRFGCRGETSKAGYFKYREKIKENVNKDRKSPILEETIPIRNIMGMRLSDTFIGNPEFDYHAHLDLAKGKDTDENTADCAGFALGHAEMGTDSKIKVIVDLMVQFKAERGKEIIFEHVRGFINYLLNERRFNIRKLTLDGYQSTDFMQIMESRGITCELVSVDRDSSAYDTLKSLIYNKRLDYYYYSVFIRECEELKLINGKVDHPDKSMRRALEEKDERGSKDVADCVAGICKTLVLDADSGSHWASLEGPDSDAPDTRSQLIEDINKRNLGEVYRKVTDGDDDD